MPETLPAREVLADSRPLKGGCAAGIATVGTAGVEVAQEVLAETQSAILPLVSYLNTLRWLFIAVALIVTCPPGRPSLIPRVLRFDIRRFRVWQARRVRSDYVVLRDQARACR
ncbi:hypothetical protein AQS8620_03284 [Aquimixticola soesokkakensis]|uniref:Uncharacterized protein n=1 Tax=Aquimixticola soesokkakensis TaxID=1519096 RepID=A0A1Y5TQ93_9RHOB|nr:hypothetical protein AQS8620_03284 [Aquimixticola soesokkakensis]